AVRARTRAGPQTDALAHRPLLDADLPEKRPLVENTNVAALDVDEPATLEVREQLVHRHPCRTDRRGEVVLRERKRSAEACDLDEVLGQSARHVKKGEVLDLALELADIPR